MNLNATTFDLINARECAVASSQAYWLGPNSSADQSPVILQNERTDTQLIVLERTDHIIIAFRGSSSLKDFILDARFFLSLLLEEADGSRCEVHSGFMDAYESIIGDLTVQLRKFVVGNRKVFITGHSLGGALAILAALELKRQGFNIAQVYTFGQPRVGNKPFAQMYNACPCGLASLKDSTFCVVNEGDPVPLLPPLLNGYRDCGTEIFIRHGSTESRPTMLVDPFIGFELVVDLLGAIQSWRNYRLGLLPNHFIAAYQQRIQNL